MPQIKLSELLKALSAPKKCICFSDPGIRGISCNSRDIKKGELFVAVRGNQADGHDYILDAVKRGAVAVVSESQSAQIGRCQKLNLIRVPDSRSALLELAARFYDNPAKRLGFIGITGTNGKTTVAYLLEAILKVSGYSPAVIGTINYRCKGYKVAAGNTTPGALQLQSLFNRFVRSGCDKLIMEVSSHALDQGRVCGISFEAAIFTNLTQDHLDYHKTIPGYFKAKSLLFKELGKDSIAVINNDDYYGRKLKKMTKAKVVTYAIDNPADLKATGIDFDMHCSRINLSWKGREFKAISRLIGRHNVYNVLAAAAYCLQSGVSISRVVSAIEKFRTVPGRLEKIKARRNFTVFVDYAHTDDALKNVITALRALPANRIITLFGCGGDRDKSKRPKMGRVATDLSDYAVITSDNPRQEKPADIIKDIEKGIRKSNYSVLVDRKDAIKKVLSLARDGDVILLAGKGHENYQIIRGRKLRFDDREVVKECLQSASL